MAADEKVPWSSATRGKREQLIVIMKVKVLVTQSCPTLCNPMNCSPPGFSVHGISQARILEWVAIPSPGDLFNPRSEPVSLALVGGFFITESPGKPPQIYSLFKNQICPQ